MQDKHGIDSGNDNRSDVNTKTISYAAVIARELHLKVGQVQAAIQLLQDGNTIPFIARYRKEMTGELDENQLRDISALHQQAVALADRKRDVLRLLEEQGVFQDETIAEPLRAAILRAASLREVDDLYRPYRPKRKTRATMARERGLLPLLEWLQQVGGGNTSEDIVKAYARAYLSVENGLSDAAEALSGALDIFAEMVADDAQTRAEVRRLTVSKGRFSSVAVDGARESVYEMYYEYSEGISTLPPHRTLAINRGEREEFLKVSIEAPVEDILNYLAHHHVVPILQGDTAAARSPGSVRGRDRGRSYGEIAQGSYIAKLFADSVEDAYKRLLAPSIEREIRGDLTEKAEAHAIHIFGENLKNLLMQPPMRGYVVLGVDPAYRTGCKLAVVDETGKMLMVSVIYPTPPQNRVAEAKQEVLKILKTYSVRLIGIGNGTASRETEAFIVECIAAHREATAESVPYVMVSEAGASVYSASVLAGQEFPDLDVAERSAISIARRLQDPLAELVKIEPKAVGVGQYQHDVAGKKLDEQLKSVVETVVNQVGVDVNTASPSLLSYVAGLNQTVAKNIVAFREEQGRIRDRKELAKVPRLGKKTLEQCVGFLRVFSGSEALDATPIHPESYPAAKRLLERVGAKSNALFDAAKRTDMLTSLRSVPLEELSKETGAGLPTLRDILNALERPMRDPREDVPPPLLRTDVLKLEDLSPGMVLSGTVRNVVDFGAFVDVGVKNDGLVHISELANRFVKHPMDVVSVGDIVEVRVLSVDVQKQRLALSMKNVPGREEVLR